MAQVKVTSYYTRRKRIDDAQPTKRRKLLVGAAEDDGEGSTNQQQASDMKAGLQAFTKQILPRIDRAVLLEDTISQCTATKSTPSTTRSRSTRKPRTTPGRSCSRKTKKGPLDAHLLSSDPKTDPIHRLMSDASSDISEPAVVSLAPQYRSPPSTPTKRPQLSDDAPSRKKRSRIGSADVALETVESSVGQIGRGPEPVRATRRKVQAGRQPSKAKKSLEASLLAFATSSVDAKPAKDNISEKGQIPSSRQSCDGDRKEIPLRRQKPSRSAHTKSSSAPKVSSPKSSSAFQEALDVASVSPGNGRFTLQAFMERTSQSVASARAQGSAVNPALSDRIKEAVSDGQRGPSKTKLTPAEMKERLSKSCKLSDLQAHLARVKECAEQAKTRQTPTRDAVSTSETDSPTATVVKIEEPALPAYQKYHALVSAAPSTLMLPFKYKLLEEMFRSTDTAVGMLHNRSEVCTFAKVKQAVQEMCRRTFEQRNLGQIRTVYPTAYFLCQQKTPRAKVNEYELVLEANTGSGMGTSAGQESSEPAQQTSHSSSQKTTAVSKLISKFTPSMLIARRSIFHSNLVDIVKEHHNEFLSKLDRPLSVPNDKLTRWHPKFPLDQVVDIEPAPLPKPPTVTTYNTAKDVLDKARVMMNPRVAKALEVVAKNSALLKADKDKAVAEQKTDIKPKPQTAPNAKSVSGVSQSLLDRIRAKEAQSLTAMMTRSPADQERIAMLERLPELCRILRVFFVSEKKAVLSIEAVVQKLSESYPSILSKGEVEKHVGLMVEVLPEWLSKVTVRKDHYLKLNKAKDMGQVNHRLRLLLKDSKQVNGQS